MTFPAQSPDLRRFPLVAGASRSVVRSPRSAAPRIRFLFVDSRVRFTLRSAYASRRTPCASLRSLRPGSGRTFTSKSSPMPGPPQKKAGSPGSTGLPPNEPGGSRALFDMRGGHEGNFPTLILALSLTPPRGGNRIVMCRSWPLLISPLPPTLGHCRALAIQ